MPEATNQLSADPNLPEWMQKTPAPFDDYQLSFYQNCSPGQVIRLTREEFLHLKACLADHQGFGAREQIADWLNEEDPEQSTPRLQSGDRKP